MGEFNFFKILEKGDKELVHSAILAYLIDNEHQFRTDFLKLPALNYTPTKLEKSISYKKQIRSKAKRIRFDVFCESANEKEVVVIENKFKSAPDDKQLKEYDEGLKKNYTANINKILFCFDKKLASKVIEGTQWEVFDYVDLLKELETGKYNGNCVDKKLFIEHYCSLLRWYINQKKSDEKNANDLFKSDLDNDERFRRRLFNARLYLELINNEHFINCGYVVNPGNTSDPLLNIVPSKWLTAFGCKFLLPFYGEEVVLQLQGGDLKFYLHFQKDKREVERVNEFLALVRTYFTTQYKDFEVKKNVKTIQKSMFICKIKVKSNVDEGVVTVDSIKKLIISFYKECEAFLNRYQE
ncbi:PD-(D/E)XK nuclease family protein [Myroides odoratus]|uniref:PD-(D/E)XK nuclease family protein n=1 Tax=Myroides odoratus TaxID=256 RepID=UPI000765BD36|nr:PD-(D/E)XK nuclease family protein [Myroides odoratus]